jgi:ABC-type lipopolysaccharide export system ATPase subunit
MENGRIVLDGTPADRVKNADVRELYLGLTEVSRAKATGM